MIESLERGDRVLLLIALFAIALGAAAMKEFRDPGSRGQGALMDAAASGDPARIAELHAYLLHTYTDMLEKSARRRLEHQRGDVRDAVGRTFERAFGLYAERKAMPAVPAGIFLLAILARVCSELRRASLRRKDHEEASTAEDSLSLAERFTDPEEAFLSREKERARQEMHARLLAAIDQLSDKQAQAVRGWIDGKKYRDIAAELGTSVGSVQQHLSRALDRLRALVTAPEVAHG